MAQVNNSLVKSQGQQKLGFTAYITQDGVKNQIANVLGSDKGQIFVSSIVSSVNTNPQLAECTNSSIVSAALLGASLNLSPSPQLGQFYMLPFNDRNRGKVAEFVLGYHGMIQLAIRSGQYKKLNVLPIKEGELKRFDPLNEEIEVELIEDDAKREETPTCGYYAFFEYVNGFRKAIYWSKAKMEAHAERYSAGYKAKKGFTFWEKDFDAMACKTMLRQIITKWGAMDVAMQKAIDNDYTVGNMNEERSFVEVEQITPAIEEKAEPVPEPAPAQETKEEKATDAQAALFG